MIRLADLSLRAKLLGAILLTTSLCLLVGFGFIFVSDVRTFRADMAEASTLMARVVADHAVGPLAFGDRVEADRILSRLSVHPGIEAAVLYDEQGRVFARFRDLPPDAPPPDAGPSRVFVGDHLHVFEPVAHEGERYGALRLVASTAGLRAKMWRQLLILAAAVLLVLATRPGAGLPDWSQRRGLMRLGLIGHGLYQGLFVAGLSLTRAGNAALVAAANPALTALVAALLGVERMSARIGGDSSWNTPMVSPRQSSS